MKNMSNKTAIFFTLVLLPLTFTGKGGDLPKKLSVHYQELTAPEFVDAVKKSQNTCMIPIGVLEKHGPDLVKLHQANTQSGEDLNRMKDLKDTYTSIWWYAKYPNHYAGDGSPANTVLGELLLEGEVSQLVKMIQSVKQDTTVLELQNQFFQESAKPLKTQQ